MTEDSEDRSFVPIAFLASGTEDDDDDEDDLFYVWSELSE